MLNRVVPIGRVVRRPEIRITPNSVSVTTVTIAVDRKTSKQTDFFNVICFGKLAENVCKFLDKGRLIAVEGHLQTRTYESNGQKRKVVEIVGEAVQFLSPRTNGADQNVDDLFAV